MTSSEAKAILLLYRPGTADAADPEIAEALDLAGRDAELGRWLEEHRTFQKAMRAKFRQIEVPPHLRTSLLIRGAVQSGIVPPQAWWRRRPIWLTAGALLILLALAGVWLRPRTPDRFANYENRMVAAALREYRMDLVTNDMRQVRQFMAQRGAPADYHLPQGLARLQLTGGGLLTWRNQPVAMVCFDRGDKEMLFLFVMKRTAVKDPPSAKPQLGKVHQMVTVSWTRGDDTYLLAGPEEADFAKKYL